MPTWDPVVYESFPDERRRPYLDLLSRVDLPAPGLVVDAGCGTGAGALMLARRWPQARVLAVDSSPAMLQRAEETCAAAEDGAGARVRLVEADLMGWDPPEPADVLVSSAVLHWLPHHVDVVVRWAGLVPPGGWLAFTVPGNFASPSHVVPRAVASQEPFASRVPGLAGHLLGPDATGSPAMYAAVLAAQGLRVDAWETTYLHVLPGEDAVLRWLRGTTLRPVLDALADEPDLHDLFLARCAERMAQAYPRRAWGTPFPFRRVFAVAQRPA